MIALNIPELKTITHQLFVDNLFDNFLLLEAEFITNIKYNIDGKLHKEYFDTDNIPNNDFESWKNIKGFCTNLIRGRRLPLSFNLTFALPAEKISKLLVNNGQEDKIKLINYCNLNIMYKNNKITITTAISYNSFILDKTIDFLWDDSVKAFLKKSNISFEIL